MTARKKWDPSVLRALIGAEASRNDATGDDTRRRVKVAQDDPWRRAPDTVHAAFANDECGEDSGRGKRHHALVGACKDAGFDLDRTTAIVSEFPPSIEKYGWRSGGVEAATRASWEALGRGATPAVVDGDSGEPVARENYLDYMVDGGSFIFDAPDKVPANWGSEDGEVLWAEGQPLMVTGPIGVGKTTLAAHLTEGRLGLRDEVLGFPIRPGKRKVLYLAMDRPLQISGALGRTLKQHNRAQLAQHLIAWPGPPPEDLARSPGLLHELAMAAGADTIIVDSLKDAVTKLTDDETGGGWNRAVQRCIADGIEVVVLHHQRKSSAGENGGKPKSVNDVYGSVWFTAGMGSILLLWGNPGAARIELSHLRPPALPLEPMWVHHDHTAGSLSPETQGDDLLSVFDSPATVRALAMQMAVSDEPTQAETERARRLVTVWVRDKVLKKVGKEQRAGGGKPADVYVRDLTV